MMTTVHMTTRTGAESLATIKPEPFPGNERLAPHVERGAEVGVEVDAGESEAKFSDEKRDSR